jgi:hypothetical protein
MPNYRSYANVAFDALATATGVATATITHNSSHVLTSERELLLRIERDREYERVYEDYRRQLQEQQAQMARLQWQTVFDEMANYWTNTPLFAEIRYSPPTEPTYRMVGPYKVKRIKRNLPEWF